MRIQEVGSESGSHHAEVREEVEQSRGTEHLLGPGRLLRRGAALCAAAAAA
jgi:hypothetical protein